MIHASVMKMWKLAQNLPQNSETFLGDNPQMR